MTLNLNNGSHLTFNGQAFNNILGNQFNVNIDQRPDVEPTEYDEYEPVKKGVLYLLKELHRGDILACGHSPRWCKCDARRIAQGTIYSVELPELEWKIKFTAIEYKGSEAREVWEAHFRHFSQNRSPHAWQLYGLNRSNVPFLIFHDELVPLGHFYKNSFWGDIFVNWLIYELGCFASEIWLNARGGLIKGPDGPGFFVNYAETINGIPITSSAKMLQDDISFQFFQRFPSTALDHLIVEYARCCFSSSPPNLPETFDGLRFDTVYSPSLGAVARCRDGGVLWEMQEGKSLVDKTVLDNGLIRFKLDGPDVNACFCLDREKFQRSWLSQSSRIIDACRMSGMEEQCYVVYLYPQFILESTTSRYLNQQRLLQLETPPPIYLFIYPFPMTLAEIRAWGKPRTHFWSLDENGQSDMTEEECRRWGIPELKANVYLSAIYEWTWPSYVYTAICNWQVARGFDPATTDYAQSLGHPVFDILIDNETMASRFEEGHGKSNNLLAVIENSSRPDKQSVPEELDTPPAVEETVTISQPPLTTSTPKPSRIPVAIPHSKVKLSDCTLLHGRLSVSRQKQSYLVGEASRSQIPIPTWRAQGKSWRGALDGGALDDSRAQLGR